MHGLLEVPHVDHLHPDSVIALAASADGEELTKRCYGDEVGWVPWRRPGFQLAVDMEALRASKTGLAGRRHGWARPDRLGRQLGGL